MSEKHLDRFRSLFWDAFHLPDLQSERFKKVWQDMEPLNDQIAGPLFSVFEKGNCDYIFKDKERFPGIQNADDLFERLTELVREYGEKAAQNPAESDEEKADLRLLLYQADVKMELAELMLGILRRGV